MRPSATDGDAPVTTDVPISRPQPVQRGLSTLISSQTLQERIWRRSRSLANRFRVIRTLGIARLSVLRTGQHLYAQIFTADGSKVLAAASTLEADVKSGLKGSKNLEAAAKVGAAIAAKAKAAGIEAVAFDRSGYRYHGRIKALADAAREGGLQF